MHDLSKYTVPTKLVGMLVLSALPTKVLGMLVLSVLPTKIVGMQAVYQSSQIQHLKGYSIVLRDQLSL